VGSGSRFGVREGERERENKGELGVWCQQVHIHGPMGMEVASQIYLIG